MKQILFFTFLVAGFSSYAMEKAHQQTEQERAKQEQLKREKQIADMRKKVDEDENLYELLGIKNPSVTQSDIDRAYRKRMLQVHPDRNKTQNADQESKRVNQAYEILSDTQLRTLYDAHFFEPENPLDRLIEQTFFEPKHSRTSFQCSKKPDGMLDRMIKNWCFSPENDTDKSSDNKEQHNADPVPSIGISLPTFPEHEPEPVPAQQPRMKKSKARPKRKKVADVAQEKAVEGTRFSSITQMVRDRLVQARNLLT